MTEKGLTLYEIVDSLSKLEEMLDDGQEVTEYLDSAQLQLNEKVENIVKINRNFELTADAIDSEIKRLTLIKTAFVKKRQRLLDWVKYSMESHGVEKIETGVARLSFIKSTTVVIDDEMQLPDAFMVERVTRTPDKNMIKKAILDGLPIKGAHVEVHKNLQVK